MNNETTSKSPVEQPRLVRRIGTSPAGGRYVGWYLAIGGLQIGWGWVLKWTPEVRVFLHSKHRDENRVSHNFHLWRLRFGYSKILPNA